MKEKTYVVGTAEDAVEVNVTEQEDRSGVYAAYKEKFAAQAEKQETEKE